MCKEKENIDLKENKILFNLGSIFDLYGSKCFAGHKNN